MEDKIKQIILNNSSSNGDFGSVIENEDLDKIATEISNLHERVVMPTEVNVSCENCKHWQNDYWADIMHDGWKVCKNTNDNGGMELENGDYATSGCYLHTAKDFGCKQFEQIVSVGSE